MLSFLFNVSWNNWNQKSSSTIYRWKSLWWVLKIMYKNMLGRNMEDIILTYDIIWYDMVRVTVIFRQINIMCLLIWWTKRDTTLILCMPTHLQNKSTVPYKNIKVNKYFKKDRKYSRLKKTKEICQMQCMNLNWIFFSRKYNSIKHYWYN